MADIAEVLAGFVKDHPELASELGKLAGDLQATAAPASPDDTAAAEEIRSGGLGALVHRIAKAVLGPLSGPEQDAVADVCGTSPAAAPAPAPAASEGEQA
jgi:hypothetical protein